MSEERRIDSAWAITLAHLWRGSAAVNRGFKLVSLYGVGGAAQTAIPDGENDVARGVWAAWTIYTSGGAFGSGTGQATPGGAALNLYNAGGNACVLTVGAGGNVTVQRTAGTLTYDVTLLCLWQ